MAIKGILYMIFASLSFGVMAGCVKWATQMLPFMEVVFFRSFLGTLLIIPIMLARRVSFLGSHPKPLLIRALMGFLAMGLHFYSISKIPLGTAVTLSYTIPLFVAILAILFLKERVSLLLASMTLMSIAGVYLLVGARLTEWGFPVTAAILSAFCAACAFTAIRVIREKESPFTIIFYFTAITSLLSLPIVYKQFQWPDPWQWIALIGIASAATLGQIGLTTAIRHAPVSLVSPFGCFTPLFSYFLGVVFWGETLMWTAVLGALLIITAGAVLSVVEATTETQTSLPSTTISG